MHKQALVLVAVAALATPGHVPPATAASPTGRSRQEIVSSLRRRLHEAGRVDPNVRSRVVDQVERSHLEPADGFVRHLQAVEAIENSSKPLLRRLLSGLGKLSRSALGLGGRQAKPASARAKRIEELIQAQRKKAAFATAAANVLEHLDEASAKGSDGADGRQTEESPQRRAGRTRVHLHTSGATAIGRRMVMHGQHGLPTIVIEPNSPRLSALRRKIVTALGPYTPDIHARTGQYDKFSEQKRGILWELPILLQRYVKLRDRAPEGQSLSAWLASTPYGEFSARRAKAGEQVTLDDYLELGEVGQREMALLTQIVLQDLGFSAQYLEGKLGVYNDFSSDEIYKWYRRDCINALYQRKPDVAHHPRHRTRDRDGYEWVQYNISTEPWVLRTFNGCPINERWNDVRNFVGTDYIFSYSGNDAPRFTHATGAKGRWWKQAKPFRPGEPEPPLRYAENRPAPERPMPKWSFTTSAEHEPGFGRASNQTGSRSTGDGSFDGFHRPFEGRSGQQRTRQAPVEPTPKLTRTQALQRLGNLSRSATAEEIHKAYRKLAGLHHPDRAGPRYDKQRWLEIQEAYELLVPKPKQPSSPGR